MSESMLEWGFLGRWKEEGKAIDRDQRWFSAAVICVRGARRREERAVGKLAWS